jgi:outer membrane protein assembly factor BamB
VAKAARLIRPMMSPQSRPGRAGAWLVLAALAVAPACAAHPPNVDPTGGADRGDPGLPVLSMRWKRVLIDHREDFGSQEFASGAIDDDTLYIGSRGGDFLALDPWTGAIRWKRRVGSVSSRPLVQQGRVYLGTDDGLLVCLDGEDGAERWRYSTKGGILRQPVLSGDMLLFSNDADVVYALDATTGAFRWQYKADMPEEYTLRGHAGVTVADDLAFTAFANGTMVALRTATGSVAWMTSLKGSADRFVDVDCRPVVDGDTVYAASSAGGVFALDRTTGLVRWRLPMEGVGSLQLAGDRLYAIAAELGVYAIDRQGNVVWRQGLRDAGEPADPVISEDYLIYALSRSGLFVADKATGRIHQFLDPGYGVSATPTVDGDMMYVLSNGGILYALQLERF